MMSYHTADGKMVGGAPLDPAKWIEQANFYVQKIKL